MTSVQISIPEEVIVMFDKAFKGQDRNAILANLMREAAEQVWRHQQQNDAIDRILELRRQTPPVPAEAIRAAREEIRLPKPESWDDFFDDDSLRVTPDFMAEREDLPLQEREFF